MRIIYSGHISAYWSHWFLLQRILQVREISLKKTICWHVKLQPPKKTGWQKNLLINNIISCSNQKEEDGRRRILILAKVDVFQVTWPELWPWWLLPALSAQLPGCFPSSSARWSQTGLHGSCHRRQGLRLEMLVLLDQTNSDSDSEVNT